MADAANKEATGAGLGMESVDEPDLDLDFLADEQPEEAAQEQEPATEDTAAQEQPVEEPSEPAATTEEPVAEETEEAPAEEPAAEVEQPTQQERRFASNRFGSIEDLEAGYQNVEQWATRASQENASLKKQMQEMEQRLLEAAPIIQQVLQGRQQDRLPEDLDTSDPQVMQQIIQQEARRIAQEELHRVEQTRTQAEQQAAQEAARTTLEEFRRENPDAMALEAEMYRVFNDFRYDPDSGQSSEDNFPVTKDNLVIAATLAREPQVYHVAQRLGFVPSDSEDIKLLREASQAPALFEELLVAPQLLETQEGHAVARKRANLPQVIQQATSEHEAQAQARAEEQRKAAHMVKGSAGAPVKAAPGKTADPWEQVMQIEEQDRKQSSIFDRL